MNRWLIFILIFGLFSCNNNEYKTVVVKGNIKNSTSKSVYLVSFGSTNNPVVLDSCLLDSKGNFAVKTLAQEQELYAIQTATMQPIWLVNDVNEISITANENNYNSYKIIGSNASAQLHGFIEQLDSLVAIKKKYQQQIDTLQHQKNVDSVLQVTQQKQIDIKKNIENFCTQSISTTNNPALQYFYIFYANKTNAIAVFEQYQFVKKATQTFKNHTQLSGLQAWYESELKTNPKAFAIKDSAAYFKYLDKDSNTIALTNYKGKNILLSFWQANNIESIKQNDVLVNLHKQYAAKNIDFIGISLDSNKQYWQKIIAKDSLTWTQVRDTLGFESAVLKKYFVTKVPYYVIINNKGKVEALDISISEVKEKLKELLP